MTDDLAKLFEAARSQPVLLRDKEEQRRSFAYGNTALENPLITRDMINKEAEKLAAQIIHVETDGSLTARSPGFFDL